MAEALTGWSSAQALERGIGEVFRLINEASGQPAADPVAYVLREARARTLGNHSALIARDGRAIPIEESAATRYLTEVTVTAQSRAVGKTLETWAWVVGRTCRSWR